MITTIPKYQIKTFNADNLYEIEAQFDKEIKNNSDMIIDHITSSSVFNKDYDEMEYSLIVIYHTVNETVHTDKL